MRLKLLLVAILSGMAVYAPEELKSSLWPGWNMPASYPEVSIGSYMQSLYSRICSLLPTSIHGPIKDFEQRIKPIMAQIDPSLKNDNLKMLIIISNLCCLDFHLLAGSYLEESKVCPEEILTILEQQPEEIFSRLASILEAAVDQKPDLVRLLKGAIGLKGFNSYHTDKLIEHLKKNQDHYPELNIDPEHFDQIYHQMCAQKYKHTIKLLLALDEQKPGRLGQLADDLGRVNQDIVSFFKRQNWDFRLQDQLIDFAKLILNWNKILYDLAPRPSISWISVHNGLTNDLCRAFPINDTKGLELFKILYLGGFANFDGDQIRIVGGNIQYATKCWLGKFFGVRELEQLMVYDLRMDDASFGLSEAGEIKIRQIISNFFTDYYNWDENYIGIRMKEGDLGSFLIKVVEQESKTITFGDTMQMSCRDLIGHMLTITEIQFCTGPNDEPVILSDLHIPLNSLKLFEAREKLADAIGNQSYDDFESLRAALLSLPSLTENNEQEINSIQNPFSFDLDP